ncbi:MAG: CheR family methyltransferase [Candidatus Heimdallarchaeota archaeon]
MRNDLSDWIAKDKRQRRRIATKHTSALRPLATLSPQETLDAGLSQQRNILDNKRRPSALLTKNRQSQKVKRPTRPEHCVFTPSPVRTIPDEHVLPTLLRHLLKKGFDISNYKEKYLKRRLRILIRKAGLASYSEYLAKLRRDPQELERLKRTFSINVTRFFRNFDAFWALFEIAFPTHFSQPKRKSMVKIWSAGCAMGPEPYTLAILVSHYRSKHPAARSARIIATDFNPDLLEVAAVAEYPSETLEETPPVFQSKYFEPVGEGHFRVNPDIKRMVKFKQHDLLSSTSVGKHEIVVCRNVLIYFSREQQEKIHRQFCNSLTPNGYLLLGGTESLPGSFRETFDNVHGPLRLYQRKADYSE